MGEKKIFKKIIFFASVGKTDGAAAKSAPSIKAGKAFWHKTLH
jgi:hypothetical protein